MKNWYALNSKPNRERYVHDALVARGIEAYLPLWHPPRLQGREQVAKPYFTSYLFAYADLVEVGISALQYTPGLRRVVLCDGHPARVDQAVIDEIRNQLAALEGRILDGRGQPLAHGDRVRITGGPFQGYDAIFDARLSSDERVRILIDFLHKRTRCEIAPEFLLKLSSRTFG